MCVLFRAQVSDLLLRAKPETANITEPRGTSVMHVSHRSCVQVGEAAWLHKMCTRCKSMCISFRVRCVCLFMRACMRVCASLFRYVVRVCVCVWPQLAIFQFLAHDLVHAEYDYTRKLRIPVPR